MQAAPESVRSGSTSGRQRQRVLDLAQLSDATGSFINPTSIGSLTSTSGGSIPAKLPVVAGTGCRIRTGSNAITSSSTFTNAFSIKIGSPATVNGRGIQVTGGTFMNNPGGTININRTGTGFGGNGVLNGVGANFTNSSTLTIVNVAFVGQHDIYNQSTPQYTGPGGILYTRLGDSVYTEPVPVWLAT